MNLLRGAAALAAGTALLSSAPVAAEESVVLTGTYRRMAVERPDGHVYDDLLVAGGRSYRLRLSGTSPEPGATIRVSASTADATLVSPLRVTRVATLSGAKPLSVTGATRTLAILAYWTAPDSVTQSRVQSQLFGDDSSWLREVSYGQVSLTGTVTPWVRITAPTSGRCYDYADQIMARAKTAAAAINYRAADYDRTLVYFPKCTGTDTTNLSGWAYEPGDSIWLNGVMDRRTSVHEHGHSFGMGHARAYSCVSNGVRVTLGGSCTRSEYGDPFDAMGQSGYVAHFSGPHKDVAGWMDGRVRRMSSSSATFTLAPFERSSTSPVAAVVNGPSVTRRYWLEYRQPVGYDGRLPAGATGGLLVRLDDELVGPGPYLLDMSPGDGSFGTAVLGPGKTWTAPDGVRLSVGAMSSSGLTVTVSGARPEPTVPSAPRSVAVRRGDHRALVTWQPPASDGHAPVDVYRITSNTGHTRTVGDGERDALFTGLTNGVTYTFSVVAVNAVGDGPAASATVTPQPSYPTVSITSPAPGSTVGGDVEVRADARPGADSLASVGFVHWAVDGTFVAAAWPSEPFRWYTLPLSDGEHTVTATARDDNGRTASHTVTFLVSNPKPGVTITSPASGTRVTGGVVTIAADATASDDGALVDRVEFATPYGSLHVDREAPYEMPWDVSYVYDGYHEIVARAIDTKGRISVPSTVALTVFHDPPTLSITSPTSSTVSGASLTVTADAVPGHPRLAVARVSFSLGANWVTDYAAPYSATFDISGVSGTVGLWVTASDPVGRSDTEYRSITIANVLPTVAITSPQQGSTSRGTSVTVTGTAKPDAGGAPVARVEVSSPFRTVTVVPDADGAWSVPWDVTGLYGLHNVTAKVVDTAGLWRQVTTSFAVARPAPAVTLVSPATTDLTSTTPVDLVATVEPAADAYATVESVCFRGNWSTTLACGTREEDGSWAARGVTLPPGAYGLDVVVTESDRYAAAYAASSVRVSGPPREPYTTSAYVHEDGSVRVSWWTLGYSDDTLRPLREWVVRESDTGNVVARSTSYEEVQFRALRPGVLQSFSVEAVNEYGASARVHTAKVLPPWEISWEPTTASRTSVTYGTPVTLKSRVVRSDGAPVAGLPVLFYGITSTGNTAGQYHVTTSSTGWATLTFAPTATARFSVAYDGYADPRYTGAWGSAVGLTVASRVTGSLTRTSMTLGTTTWLNGLVRPATRGRSVYLQRYLGGAWRTGTYRGQNVDGTAAFAIRPTARGTYTYRLYYGGDGWRSPGWTPALTVRVY